MNVRGDSGSGGGWRRGTVLRLAALVLCLTAAFAAVPTGGARAQQGGDTGDRQPVLMTADQLDYNEQLATVTARGDVEIVQQGRILRADAVTYNQRDDIVSASGNVTVLEPSGEVLFAEYAELTGNLREGFLRGMKMLLEDDSRMVAVSGQRRGGNLTQLDRAAYSPCVTCEGFGDEPLWQIKARRVTHNQEDRMVEYDDASIEVLGVPVAYTPYLSHPDPTVERKTGFLSPTFGASTLLGGSFQAPYFWAISEDKDLLFDPIIATDEYPVITGEYRQRFGNGETRTRLSSAYDDARGGGYSARGHIDSSSKFAISPIWRWGSEVHLASDDTYLQRYGFDWEETLVNRLYAEGFGSRSYAVAEGYYFQGMRATDDQDTIPIVLPRLDYRYVSDPGRFGGSSTMDANFRAITREEGATSQRISIVPGWQASHTNSMGIITSVRAALQADLYHVDEVQTASGQESGVTGRLFPQAMINWRYPWVRRAGNASQLFEPILALVAAPNGGNPSLIPNEDSQGLELDDTNLFSMSRFPGRDRVEGGQRVVYGVRTGWFGDSGGSTTLFLGQSYSLKENDDLPSGTGLSDNLSDYVASATVSPITNFDLRYKTRIDKDSFRARRSEIAAGVGPKALRLDLDYVFFDKTQEFPDREEMWLSLSSQITEAWGARVYTRQDLTDGGGTLSYGGEVTYHCDCMDFTVQYRRNFTRDRDIPPTEALIFRITLKSLGEFQTAAF